MFSALNLIQKVRKPFPEQSNTGQTYAERADPGFLVSIEFLSLTISILLLTLFYKFVHCFFLFHSTHLLPASTSRGNHQDLEFYEFMTSWWRASPAAINFIK